MPPGASQKPADNWWYPEDTRRSWLSAAKNKPAERAVDAAAVAVRVKPRVPRTKS